MANNSIINQKGGTDKTYLRH